MKYFHSIFPCFQYLQFWRRQQIVRTLFVIFSTLLTAAFWNILAIKLLNEIQMKISDFQTLTSHSLFNLENRPYVRTFLACLGQYHNDDILQSIGRTPCTGCPSLYEGHTWSYRSRKKQNLMYKYEYSQFGKLEGYKNLKWSFPTNLTANSNSVIFSKADYV